MIGRTLGNYRLVEQVGTGGMATVYKGYDPVMDRYVAVKVLAEHLSRSEKFRHRFQREAKAIARLEHIHILPIFGYGEEERVAYMVMRYLDSGTLTDRLLEGPLPLDEASRLLGQIASALDYAHSKGILHRDVKPSNVLLDESGNTYLTDFGIAKMLEATTELTGDAILGTPTYMSPEQCQGAKDLTAATDIYSLGIILYEMVTGERPFDAETPLAIIYKHLNDPLPRPRLLRPDLPEAVERVIFKALAKDPSARYESAGEMAAALAQVIAGEPAARGGPVRSQAAPERTEFALPPGMPEVKDRRFRLPRTVWGLLGVALVAGVIAVVLMVSGGGPAEREDPATATELTGREPSPLPTSAEEVQPTERATPTQAPSPLPTTPKAIATVTPITAIRTPSPIPEITLGTEDNPLVWGFAPVGDTAESIAAAQDIVLALGQETGLRVRIQTVSIDLDLVDPLCSDPIGVHMANLGSIPYLHASDRGCADAALVAIRFGSPTYGLQFLARADSGITGLDQLAGRTFCRADASSVTSWIIPRLELLAAGMNPDNELSLIDTGSHQGVVEGVYSGQCYAGATYVDARQGMESEIPGVMEAVAVIYQRMGIPTVGVQFATMVPQDVRDQIVAALLKLAETDVGQEAMETAFDWEGLEAHTDSYYDAFRRLLEAAGVSPAEL